MCVAIGLYNHVQQIVFSRNKATQNHACTEHVASELLPILKAIITVKCAFKIENTKWKSRKISFIFSIFCIITLVNAINLADGENGLVVSIFLIFLIIFYYNHFDPINAIFIPLILSCMLLKKS